MFSTLYDTYFPFYIHIKMSSAIRFNLDQSKIWLSGNGSSVYDILAKQKTWYRPSDSPCVVMCDVFCSCWNSKRIYYTNPLTTHKIKQIACFGCLTSRILPMSCSKPSPHQNNHYGIFWIFFYFKIQSIHNLMNFNYQMTTF